MKKTRDPQAFMDAFIAFKRCVNAVAVEMYADLGMGGTQVRFLKHIAQQGQSSQAELARATDTDPALTGRALQSLLERGVLRRERSKTDRREYLVDLGPTGAESVAEVQRLHARLAERLVKPLHDRDLKDFERITERLVEVFGGRDTPEPLPPNKTKLAPVHGGAKRSARSQRPRAKPRTK